MKLNIFPAIPPSFKFSTHRQHVHWLLKGTVEEKKWTHWRKIASNEVSTCSGCCCWILQLCDVCKGGLGGLNGTTIHHYLRNVCRKIALVNRLSLATSKEPKFDSYRTDIGIKKKRIFVIYKAIESFFLIPDFWKKLSRLEFRFLGKNVFFWRNYVKLGNKIEIRKNSP